MLSDAELNKDYLIVRLFSSDPDFFDFCVSHKLTLGSTIKVEKIFDEMKMREVSIEGNKLLLNEEFTNIIYVK